MTTIPKNPTHKDNIYHIYLDAANIHIWNSFLLKIKHIYKKFIIFLTLTILPLCVYLFFNQHDRITTCERLSLDVPVHCTIVNHYRFRAEKIILSKDIADIKKDSFSSPRSIINYVYMLVPSDGSKEVQIKAAINIEAERFSLHAKKLISPSANITLPKHIQLINPSDHKRLIITGLLVYIFLIFVAGGFMYALIAQSTLSARYIAISRKDGNITFDDDERYPLSLIRRVEIKKEESDYSRLTIYLSGTNKTISMLGKNVLLQQQIKSMLEQWAKEAKLADQNKQ